MRTFTEINSVKLAPFVSAYRIAFVESIYYRIKSAEEWFSTLHCLLPNGSISLAMPPLLFSYLPLMWPFHMEPIHLFANNFIHLRWAF